MTKSSLVAAGTSLPAAQRASLIAHAGLADLVQIGQAGKPWEPGPALRIGAPVTALASSEGGMLVCADIHGSLHLWGPSQPAATEIRWGRGSVRALGLSEDAQWVAVSRHTGGTFAGRLDDPVPKALRVGRSGPLNRRMSLNATVRTEAFAGATGFAFGCETDALIAVYGDARMLEWRLADAALERWIDTTEGESSGVLAVSNGAAEATLLTADETGRVASRDRLTGTVRWINHFHAWPVLTVRAPGMTSVGLSIAGDGSAQAWDQRNGRLLFTMSATGGTVTSGCVEKGQTRIVLGALDGELIVWSGVHGRVAAWKAHAGRVTGVESLGRGTICSSGHDGFLRLWHCPEV